MWPGEGGKKAGRVRGGRRLLRVPRQRQRAPSPHVVAVAVAMPYTAAWEREEERKAAAWEREDERTEDILPSLLETEEFG